MIIGVLALGIFMAFGYPAMGRAFTRLTPPGGAYDTAFCYSPREAASRVDLYSQAARNPVILLHWTYDLAFPLLYGWVLGSFWAAGLRAWASPGTSPRYIILLIPLGAVLFDLAENSAVSVLLWSGAPPLLYRFAAVAASIATPAKWVLAAVSGLGALAAAGLLIRGSLKGRGRRRGKHEKTLGR